VVPLLDESSIQPLIELALSLTCPEHGMVVAVLLAIGEPEEIAYRLHQIEPIIESFKADGQPVELYIHTSVSMTRGILDVAREIHADILLLDAQLPSEGGAQLGTVVENIIPVSPCPVILCRTGSSSKFGRVVVPILEGNQAHAASQLALALGRRIGAPVEALFLELGSARGEPSYWNETKQQEATSFDQRERAHVKQSVVSVENEVGGFVSHAQDDDLAVADINEQAEWERWLRRDASMQALRRWPGAFLVNATGAFVAPRSRLEKLKSWLKPRLTQFEAEELKRDADESSYSSLDFLVLIVIAAILAAFGLVLNSNAVIIGAMLVAPLMTPLIAFATGVAVGQFSITRQAAGTLLQGILAALLVALLIGWLSPTRIVTPEMAGRGNATFLDLGVALASGFIGAYAKGRKDISSALAGIAIAAALMPPLVTVGLAITFQDYALAQGATLLFLTNIVSITLAAWLTFIWLGLHPGKSDDPEVSRRTSIILVVLLLSILVALTTRRIDTVAAGRIETVLRDSFQHAELVNYEVRQGDPLEVVAVVRQPLGIMDDTGEIIIARDSLQELLDKSVKLSVVLEPLVDADVAAANADFSSQIERIFEEYISSGELIDSLVIVGNPTIVFAIVSTDADPSIEPFASEIQAAEAALSEAAGLPIELQILTTDASVSTEVDASNAAFAEIIEQTLNTSLKQCELVNFTFEVGNPFIVEATILTALDQDSEEFLIVIETAEEALSEALGVPVLLTVTVVSPGTIITTPTDAGAPAQEGPESTIPTAEGTSEVPPEATEEPSPTDEDT
jgi:uncharacterized hydrophobic protein (TIGR00271 family)